MLMSNPKIDAPYCYLSRLEGSCGELTIGCNIKSTVCFAFSSDMFEVPLLWILEPQCSMTDLSYAFPYVLSAKLIK